MDLPLGKFHCLSRWIDRLVPGRVSMPEGKFLEIIHLAEDRCHREVVLPRAELRARQARELAVSRLAPAGERSSAALSQRLRAWLTHPTTPFRPHHQPR